MQQVSPLVRVIAGYPFRVRPSVGPSAIAAGLKQEKRLASNGGRMSSFPGVGYDGLLWWIVVVVVMVVLRVLLPVMEAVWLSW